MAKEEKSLTFLNSVSEIHRLLLLPPPKNPLITLVNHQDEPSQSQTNAERLVLNFYQICIKRNFRGLMKYGRNYYDFDKGTMTFSAPQQVISVDLGEEKDDGGWSLIFHPDLIRNYPLGKTIRNYGFFSYETNEALYLSEEEEILIENLVNNIRTEYESLIDNFSADVIVSNLELLLNYCNRFYSRQFTTRKMANSDLLNKFEQALNKHFDDDFNLSLPTVNSLASELGISSSYLSDMLRNCTGKNTQQHIYEKLIEKAKEKLVTTNLSVSEIAFKLGFEYPQSFSKLFKRKMDMSPLEYRQSYS
jgi:AraC-like DNA-binding protein